MNLTAKLTWWKSLMTLTFVVVMAGIQTTDVLAVKEPGASKGMPALQGQEAVDYLKQKGLYGKLCEQVEASRLEIGWDAASGYTAENRRQNMRARFSREGALIGPV